jgi:hypothetical protein
MDPIELLRLKAQFFHMLSNMVLIVAVPVALYAYVAYRRWINSIKRYDSSHIAMPSGGKHSNRRSF